MSDTIHTIKALSLFLSFCIVIVIAKEDSSIIIKSIGLKAGISMSEIIGADNISYQDARIIPHGAVAVQLFPKPFMDQECEIFLTRPNSYGRYNIINLNFANIAYSFLFHPKCKIFFPYVAVGPDIGLFLGESTIRKSASSSDLRYISIGYKASIGARVSLNRIEPTLEIGGYRYFTPRNNWRANGMIVTFGIQYLLDKTVKARKTELAESNTKIAQKDTFFIKKTVQQKNTSSKAGAGFFVAGTIIKNISLPFILVGTEKNNSNLVVPFGVSYYCFGVPLQCAGSLTSNIAATRAEKHCSFAGTSPEHNKHWGYWFTGIAFYSGAFACKINQGDNSLNWRAYTSIGLGLIGDALWGASVSKSCKATKGYAAKFSTSIIPYIGIDKQGLALNVKF